MAEGLRFAACGWLLVGAGAAWAQAKAGEGTLGAGSGPMLTREQLRQCLVERDELKKASLALAGDQKALDDEKGALGAAATELREQLDRLDRTNADAVQAHVAKAKAHDEQVGAWNAKLAPFNERVRAHGKRNEEWKSACGDRRYREDDLLLLQGRKQVPVDK